MNWGNEGMNRKTGILWVVVVVLASVLLIKNTDAREVLPQDAKEVYREAGSAIFYIRNLTEAGTLRSVGTGFFISKSGQAATAYHVVKGAAALEVTLADGRVIKDVRITGFDELTDTALLQLPKPAASQPYPAIPMRSESVVHGERVFAIGYPLKNTPIITEGIINSPNAEINSRDRILISATIASGMSGGPVLDDYGSLIGIVSGSLRTMQGIHLVAGMEQLQKLLDNKE